MLAECWALRDGLFLAIQLGIQNLEVELDAKVVVDLINSNSQSVYYSSGGLQVAAKPYSSYQGEPCVSGSKSLC